MFAPEVQHVCQVGVCLLRKNESQWRHPRANIQNENKNSTIQKKLK